MLGWKEGCHVPLKFYKNRESGEEKRSLKPLPLEEWEELIIPPNTKFMEVSDAFSGKHRIQNQQAILKERARNYARDVDAADQITVSQVNGMAQEATKNLMNKDREKRRKIDDL